MKKAGRREREKKVEDDKGIKAILSLTAETKHYLKEIWKRRNIYRNTRREKITIIEHNYAK